jgi:uncharacterized protein YdhG (YjbR/CyaY superfamily)
MNNKKPSSVDEYLSTLPDAPRTTLEKVRAMIKGAVPDAAEGMAYGMPGYKYDGRPLIYFAAAKNHLGLYGIPTVIEAHKAELAQYDLSKGVIRFPIDKAPSQKLMKSLLKARIAEIEAQNAGRKRPAKR